MKVLGQLEPKGVYHFFEEISAIPRGSGETKAISDYLAAYAKKKGFRCRQDASNNVIIWKEASPGYENSPGVMIQGHMDMVCEKDDDCTKDMRTEGLDLFIDGDLIGAKGTTLGGDDGIAVAMALAVLDDDTIPHGPLECVFTVDEEIGLLGVQALDTSDLSSKYLLNIDSEKDKVLTVSCAGSARVLCSFPVKREAFDGEVLEISLSGLAGGHSGEEIHMERANANILLGRALFEINKKTDMRLIHVKGGAKDNAIPRAASAVIAVSDRGAAEEAVAELCRAIEKEFFASDPEIKLSIQSADGDVLPMTAETTQHVVCFQFCVPNGVQNMSAAVPGLVQTSINLGRVFEENETVVYSFMPRSSVNSQKQEVLDKLDALCSSLGGKMNVTSSYSAWEYRPVSRLREVITECFRRVYGEEPSVEALHAGLECGIISGSMPELDCISIGPDLTDIHTPRERLHIASTERIWKLLLETMKCLK